MEIYTLEDLLRYTKDKGLQVLLKYRGFGAHSLALLKESLIKKAYSNAVALPDSINT